MRGTATRVAAVIALALAVAAGAVEIGLRTVFPPSDFGGDPMLAKRFHPHWKLRFVSGLGEFDTRFVYNSAGMRDREAPRTKPCGTARIVAIGDGFTEGREVGGAEHWPDVLESLLADQLDVEVINAGRSGSATALHYLVLKHFALPREPDLVILAFFLNDVAENALNQERFEWDADGLPLRLRGRRLLLSNLVRDQLARLPWGWTEKTTRSPGRGPAETDTLAALRRPAAPEVEAMWRRSERLVLAASRLATRAGADFLLLVTPLGDQIDPGRLSPYARALGLDRGDLGRGPQDRLLRFGRERGVAVLDPLPELGRSGGELHFPHDGHWNAAGHRALAGILRDHLVTSGWVERQRDSTPDCAAASGRSR